VDVTGQSGSTTPANANGRHGEGHPANGWGDSWSGAGSALEPEPDSVVPAWRRGMDALSQPRANTPPRYAEILADAGVRPPQAISEQPEGGPLFEAPEVPADPAEFAPLNQDAFPGLPDDDLLGAAPLGGPFGPLNEPSGALTEDTPAQGTPNPFARLLDVAPVPSAPPAPRSTTYPVQPPPVQPHSQLVPPHQPLSMQGWPAQGQPVQGQPVQGQPPARPGLRTVADPVAPVSGPAYAPASAQPGVYGGPSVLTPPGGQPTVPGTAMPGTAVPGAARTATAVPETVPVRPAVPEDLHRHHGQGEDPPGHGGNRPGYGSNPPGYGSNPPAQGANPPGYGPPHPRASPPGLGAWGSQMSEGQDRRAPRSSLEPGFEEPELETQVDEVEQPYRIDPAHGLPQRVPAEPDVPGLAEQPPATEPPAPAPVLSRVASGLRRDDLPPADRPDAFDVAAVLSAVRDVPGVRDAQLRATATGGHTLRLDLADGSDPAYVSRVVARMLNERMGLTAEPPGGQTPEPPAAEPPQGYAEPSRPPAMPMQSGWQPPTAAYADEVPTGRMPVPPAQRSGPPLPPGLVPASSAPRDPRRRHPAGTRGRYPSEVRPGGLTSNDRVEHEAGRPRALTPPADARRVVLDHVQVSTFGLDATVEVRLVFGERVAMGVANGPAVDGYILRLSAAAAANAVDELLGEAAESGSARGHCYVEQASIVPLGSCEVAVVVVLLVCDGWVEQLAGSAIVSGDPRQAVVRATLAAVNRRLTALLS
jgi:hypothetical protein